MFLFRPLRWLNVSISMMKMAESSLKAFFEGEPEIYSLSDVKVRYRHAQGPV